MKERIDFEKLPPNWTVAELGEHLERITNGLTATQERDPPGIPVSRIETISDGTVNFEKVRYIRELDEEKKQNFLLKEGDLLFSHINSDLHLGKTAVYRSIKPLVHGMNLLLLRTQKETLDPYYLHYLLNYYRRAGKFMEIAQHAVNQSSLNQKKIKGLRIPLAPIDQQKQIVAEIEKQFSRLDEAVANLKRVKANLKRYKAAVLKAAVEGKLTEEWRKAHPDVEPASELLKRILAERRAKWKGKGKYKDTKAPDATDLRPLPDNWIWTTTGQLCDCIVPNRDKPKSFSGEIPWITLPDFEESSIDVYKARSGLGLTREEIERDRARLIPADSVVMSCVGRFGIAGVCRTALVINQQLHAFLVPSGLNNRYFAYAIKTQVPYMDSIATATTIRYLNKDNCNSVPIPLPPEPEQCAIVEGIERIFSSTVRLHTDVEADLGRADNLRQSILQKAFLGQLVGLVQNSRGQSGHEGNLIAPVEREN